MAKTSPIAIMAVARGSRARRDEVCDWHWRWCRARRLPYLVVEVSGRTARVVLDLHHARRDLRPYEQDWLHAIFRARARRWVASPVYCATRVSTEDALAIAASIAEALDLYPKSTAWRATA